MDTGALVSSGNENSLIRALVDGSYEKTESPSFQDFSMNQSNETGVGDGRSFKSHLDVFKDASEIKLS